EFPEMGKDLGAAHQRGGNIFLYLGRRIVPVAHQDRAQAVEGPFDVLWPFTLFLVELGVGGIEQTLVNVGGTEASDRPDDVVRRGVGAPFQGLASFLMRETMRTERRQRRSRSIFL